MGFIGTIGVSQAIDVNILGARLDIGKEGIKNIVFKENSLRRLMTTKSLRLENGHNMSQIMIMKKLDDDIYVVQELTRAIHHSRSVYIITENGADIKFTGSKESIVGWSIDPKHMSKSSIKSVGGTINAVSDFRYETRQQPKGSKWEDTNIEYTDLNKSLLQNTLNERLEKRKDSVRFVDGDVFTYPGLEKATWDVIGFDGHLVVGTINFTLPKTPTISYHIGQSLNKDIIKNYIKDDTSTFHFRYNGTFG